MINFLAPQLLLLYALAGSAIYVHFRGRERLVLRRQLVDHSTFLAPYNVLLYMFSGVPNKPVLPVETFPELKTISDNWQTIREEAVRLFDEGRIRSATANNDWGFYSFFKSGWKRFYLKWYDDVLPSAQTLCPKTVELVQSIPSIKGAMFTVLPAGARLGGHRDPFAGSLRYHLGLVTPNSDECLIYVDGEPYSWRDGDDIVFDETYVHWAENKTDQTRVILFCDVERPLKTSAMRAINRFMSRVLGQATATQNVETERVGAVNRLYGFAHRVGERKKAFKRRHPRTYRYGRYALILLVAAWLVLPWIA